MDNYNDICWEVYQEMMMASEEGEFDYCNTDNNEPQENVDCENYGNYYSDEF